MKISYRKIIFWVLVIVVIAVVLVRPGTHIQYDYRVETISNKCTFDESPEQDNRAVSNSIVIIMPIQTPTPCYEVEGKVSSVGTDLIVDLDVKEKGEVCVECVGITVARVTISNLDKGTYGLQVNTPDKAIITTIMIE